MSGNTAIQRDFEMQSAGVAVAQHPDSSVSGERTGWKKVKTRVERKHSSRRKLKRKLLRIFIISLAFFGSFAIVAILRKVPYVVENGYKQAKEKTVQLAVDSFGAIPKEKRSEILKSVIKDVDSKDIEWAKKNADNITNNLSQEDKQWVKDTARKQIKGEK